MQHSKKVSKMSLSVTAQNQVQVIELRTREGEKSIKSCGNS